MTKAELISKIAEKAQTTKVQAESCMEALIAVVGDELAAGEKVALPGLGTFTVAERAARNGRNPKTGEAMEIAASRAVRFKLAKAVKDKL